MSTKLAERFQAAQGAPVEVDGQLAHMMYELPPVTAPLRLRIALKPGGERPEGLRLKARNGQIVVNDQALEDVVLWSDSAPPEVEATLEPAGSKPMSVRVWNTWRDQQGATQAWIGDAGMVVEEAGDGRVTLHCSDGFDRPSFGDLVAELAVEPA
jgi:hypothetical protein